MMMIIFAVSSTDYVKSRQFPKICVSAYLLICITCPSSLFRSFMLCRASRVQTANPSTFTFSMLRHSSVLPSEINTANSSQQQRNPTLQNSYSLQDYCYR